MQTLRASFVLVLRETHFSLSVLLPASLFTLSTTFPDLVSRWGLSHASVLLPLSVRCICFRFVFFHRFTFSLSSSFFYGASCCWSWFHVATFANYNPHQRPLCEEAWTTKGCQIHTSNVRREMWVTMTQIEGPQSVCGSRSPKQTLPFESDLFWNTKLACTLQSDTLLSNFSTLYPTAAPYFIQSNQVLHTIK